LVKYHVIREPPKIVKAALCVGALPVGDVRFDGHPYDPRQSQEDR
jgi:hypothetical protein